MYGSPTDTSQPIRTLTLDVPEDLRYVVGPPENEKSALYVIGPLQEDQDTDELPRIYPQEREWEGHVARFTFAEPFAPGRYRVVVHESRLDTESGDPLHLSDDVGPWTGWELNVTYDARAREERTDEPVVLDAQVRPPRPASDLAPVVFLDGTPIKQGASELSGEVLTVETQGAADVRLRVDPLIPGTGNTLYERYLTTRYDEESDIQRAHFVSFGPTSDFAWAQYHGFETEGRMRTDNGRLLIASPVIRTPKSAATDPLATMQTSEVTEGDNTYELVYYEVTPHDPDAPVESYRSRTLVYDKEINDAHNTPKDNPRLFPDARYLSGEEAPTASNQVASLDLPLASRLTVLIDGDEVWHGQTRLVPLFVSLSHYRNVTGQRGNAMETRYALFRASLEAASLWKCRFQDDYVPSTVQEYVLARLDYGFDARSSDGGYVSVQVGDATYQGEEGHLLRQRLARLAKLLERCEEEAPIFAEDDIPSTQAYVASEVRPSIYPTPTTREITERYAPLYGASSRQTRIEQLDPSSMRRPY